MAQLIIKKKKNGYKLAQSLQEAYAILFTFYNKYVILLTFCGQIVSLETYPFDCVYATLLLVPLQIHLQKHLDLTFQKIKFILQIIGSFRKFLLPFVFISFQDLTSVLF